MREVCRAADLLMRQQTLACDAGNRVFHDDDDGAPDDNDEDTASLDGALLGSGEQAEEASLSSRSLCSPRRNCGNDGGQNSERNMRAELSRLEGR